MRPAAMTHDERGISIGTVLLLLLVLTILGTVLVGASATQLWVSRRQVTEVGTLNSARSVVAAAVEAVYKSEDLKYAGSLELRSGRVSERTESSYAIADVGQDWAGLTFDQDQAESWAIPYSTNNVGGTSSVLGWGEREVPAGGIHLIGVAKDGTLTRSVEAILVVVEFPYAVVSSGPIRTRGSFTVATLSSSGSDDLLPADVASNNGEPDAIVLGPGSLVTGDVQAVGGVSLPQPNEVELWGEIRNGSDPVQIPELDIEGLRPDFATTAVEELLNERYPEAEQFSGTVYSSHGQVVLESDVELDGALFFADGDIVFEKDVTGTGIIAATGSIRVNGKSDLQGASRLALVSMSDIELQGTATSGSVFRGLVYANSFVARQVEVRGSLVVNGDESSAVDLTDSSVLFEPLTVETVPVPIQSLDAIPRESGEPLRLALNPSGPAIEVYDQGDFGDIVMADFFADPASFPEIRPVTSVAFESRFLGIGRDGLDGPGWDALLRETYDTERSLVEALKTVMDPDRVDVMFPSHPINELHALTTTLMGAIGNGTPAPPSQDPLPEILEGLNLGEFLRPEERTRLVFWSESGAL